MGHVSRKRLTLVGAILCILALCGCNSNIKRGGIPVARPSVYYWRTSFSISDKENAWMKQENITKMYLRLFDVTMKGYNIKPNATLRIKDDIPNGMTYVPTVFVDNDVFLKGHDDHLGWRIMERVKTMCETHSIRFHEVQLDCDWTERTQEKFFNMIEEMQQCDSTMRFSATIRLHQLNMPAPPVKYGVLMLYNTGDFRTAYDANCHNPILDHRDVEPYMKYMKDYPLAICAAYPNFSWQLLFDGKTFKGILYGEDLNDSTLYRKVNKDDYVTVGTRTISMQMGEHNLRVLPGETVKVWHSDKDEIKKVKDMVESARPDISEQTVTYYLDEKNIQ